MSNQWDIFCFVPLLGKSSSRAITFFYFTNTSPMNAFSDKILTKQKGEQVNLDLFGKKGSVAERQLAKAIFVFGSASKSHKYQMKSLPMNFSGPSGHEIYFVVTAKGW